MMTLCSVLDEWYPKKRINIYTIIKDYIVFFCNLLVWGAFSA